MVGAGIAGVATAFFILRDTCNSVLLIERDRVARGATGRNAGQLTTYFERPLCDIADEFGVERAVEAQRGFDGAHDLFDLMVAETGATVRVERFTGHMGMFNLHHLQVHLRNNLIRRQGGWRTETCVVSEEAEFRDALPADLERLYDVVPQARVRELLDIDDDRYCAVLSVLKGSANSGLLSQQALAYLKRRYAGRFRFVDRTNVASITVGEEGATLQAGGHDVTAGCAVLCTNGFVDHSVVDAAGSPIRLAADQEITGRVAYMTAFVEDEPRPAAAMSYIRNEVIGDAKAYVYVTRRTYDRPDDVVTLTCMGGPEYPFHEPVYDPDEPFPGGSARRDGRGGAAVRQRRTPARAAIRLPLARPDGLQRQRDPRHRSPSPAPEPAVQPRLQRRRLPPVDLRRTPAEPGACRRDRSRRASSIRAEPRVTITSAQQ